MNRRQFLHTSAALGVGAGLCPLSHLRSGDTIVRPNIILIVADNLGRESVGYYGHQRSRTPRLDHLASEGIVFDNCLISTSLCGPARCAWNTGRHAYRVGMNRQCDWHKVLEEPDFGLPAEEITIAEILRNAGYRTSLFGKWNLGNAPKFNPLHHGFDEFYGSTLGNAHYYTHQRHGKRSSYRGLKPVNDHGYIDKLFTDEAIDFLDRQKDNKKPFYVNLCYYAPHGPYVSPPGYERSNTSKANYRNMIEYMDKCIGRVVDKVEELGLSERTLIVFLSDQGGSYLNQYGRTLRDNSLKVICNARWKGRIPAGIRVRSPWVHYDLFATFAFLGGGEIPKDRVVDARNVWPLFEGKEQKLDRVLHWTANENCFMDECTQDAVRIGNMKLLIYKGKATGREGLRQSPNGVIPHPDKIRGLYDLS